MTISMGLLVVVVCVLGLVGFALYRHGDVTASLHIFKLLGFTLKAWERRPPKS